MKKGTLLKVVNPILALLLLSQATSGILHDKIPYEMFSAYHGPMGLALVSVALVHLILNWSWVKGLFKKR